MGTFGESLLAPREQVITDDQFVDEMGSAAKQRAPAEGEWRVAVDTLIKESKKLFECDTRIPKYVYDKLLNYSVYWSAMGTMLVAGQSFRLWTDGDQEAWSVAWSEVTFLGYITGPVSHFLSVPVLLTFYCGVHYMFLAEAILAMTHTEKSKWYQRLYMPLRPIDASVRDRMDLSNVPLFPAAFGEGKVCGRYISVDTLACASSLDHMCG